MYRFEDVTIRKFTFEDIPNKIKWINDSKNNEYLHYDLPLEYEKTCKWYENNKDKTDRFDAVIEYKGKPVGLVGLLSIDYKNKKAEDYMIIGNHQFKNKGIATKAGHLNQLYAFEVLKLNKLYALIEVGNEKAVKLYKRRGFEMEGRLNKEIVLKNRVADIYYLGSFKDKYTKPEGLYEE